MSKACCFNSGDFVVYPTHGVGRVMSVVSTEIEGKSIEGLSIHFDKENMTQFIPMEKLANLRPLSSKDVMALALEELKGKSKTNKAIWNRRSVEYDAKINSGDPIQVAEVLRDLSKTADRVERSYSERQTFERAFERFVNEYAMSEEIDVEEASVRVRALLKTEEPVLSAQAE